MSEAFVEIKSKLVLFNASFICVNLYFPCFSVHKKFNVIPKSICEIIFHDNFSFSKEVFEGKNYVQSLILLNEINFMFRERNVKIAGQGETILRPTYEN